ncbi:MAG: glycosyltransferase family 2 protein [Patescibacteria group bacterium]|nr:glycosyltransferase family 2 protein [Patescibacteria group bacterium]
MEKKLLSIIIVHFNTPDLLLACLTSLHRAKKDHDLWEVIVVDNGSSDACVKELKKIQRLKMFQQFVSIIYNKENYGFSKGNNIGITESKGDYILLLNSDTEVQDGAIQKTLAVFRDSTVGAATCKLILPDGSIDPACHRGFPTPWAACTYFSGLDRMFPFIPVFSQYHQLYKDLSVVHEIDVASGAFFLVRRDVVEHVGLLDESFFMYGEDIDWAYRIKQKGYKILFVPDGIVLHKKKQSGRKSKDSNIRKQSDRSFYETMKLFYKKHYQDKYPRIITRFIFFLIDLKLRMI